MNISSPVTDPVTPLGAAPAILAAANLLLPHLERGQRVDAAILRNAMETAFGASGASGAWDWKLVFATVSTDLSQSDKKLSTTATLAEGRGQAQ